ncbi:MAG: AraC family transcriptional regulator [Myxococcota bacterium]
MGARYQDAYPSEPILDSAASVPRAASLLTLEYFEAPPGRMPDLVYEQHHILLNLQDRPQEVENHRDGKRFAYTLEPHDIVVTPAGMRSGWAWFERSRVLIVTLLPDALEAFVRHELRLVLRPVQLAAHARRHDPDLCLAGVQLKEALERPGIGSSVVFEALARVFLVKLVDRYGVALEEGADDASFDAGRYRRVVEYVAAHLADNITVEQLAKVVAMSPSHFARTFKRTVGQSPHRFVMSYRVERAKAMLDDDTLALAEVAHRCGFADQAHFSRTFKRFEGQSPSAYRKG